MLSRVGDVCQHSRAGVHQHEVQGEGGPHRDQGERQPFFFKTFLFLSDLFFLNRTSKHCQFEQNDNDNVRLNNQDFKIISQDLQ